MILESARLDVRQGQEDAFLLAVASACPLIEVQPGFRTLELRRCLDEDAARGSCCW
jgi:heme-degrading monooxygenase HmoA